MKPSATLIGTGVVSGAIGIAATASGVHQSEGLSGADALALAAPSWIVAVVLLLVAGFSLVGVLMLWGVADLINQSRALDESSAKPSAPALD